MVFVGVSRLDVLEKHSYALDVGWQTPAGQTAPQGECDRLLTKRGFPLTIRRPAPADADPTGCLDQTDPLASAMNYAIYFAAACILSVGVVGAVRSRL